MTRYLLNIKFSHRLLFSVGLSALTLISANFTNSYTIGPTLCTFRLLTGKPCPFCGTTRSLGSIFQGEFVKAWNYNPLGFIVLALFLILIVNPKLFRKLQSKSNSFISNFGSQNRFLFISILFALTWIINTSRW